MPDSVYLVVGIALVAAITYGLRAGGFLARRVLKSSPLLSVYEQWMPLSIVSILCVYCVAGFDFRSAPQALPEVVGVLVTVGMHLWKRNMLLSMATGAATCIILANWVIPLVVP